jgi:hypothetical protein
MEFTKRRRAAFGALAAAAVCGGLVMAATSASASGDPTPPASHQAVPGAGAVDLQGHPVQSRTYVGEAPSSDMETLQRSRSATAGPGPITGTFPE